MEKALRLARQALPILDWAPDYDGEDARGDLTAAFTVAVMLVPQGMAYAVLAGVPPIYGLYTSVVPLLVYPLIGSSRHLAVGLNAVPMIVIAAGLTPLAEPGSGRYVELAILLTLMVGLLQVAMGSLRLGFLANLLSRPVIAGFATAAAVIIVASQIGNFIGVDLGRSIHVHQTVLEAAARAEEVHWPSVAIGGGSVAVIAGLRWWKSLFPAELAVIVLATVATWGLGLESRGVHTVGLVPGGLPLPDLPSLAFGDIRALVPTAVTLALIQFLSVVSLGRIFANRHRYSIDANRELTGVGAANVTGSLFFCLPASGSFSRTAVNEQAGARTPMANMLAALLVALVLLFFTPLFANLPMPALAAVIVVAAVGLLDAHEISFLFRTKRVEGWVAMITLSATLLIGIIEGLLLGIGAAVVAVLYRQSRPHVAELGHLSATRSFKNLERFGNAYTIEGLIVLRIEAGFSFFNAEFLKDFILEKAKTGHGNVRAVVIDGSSINDLDTTALDALEDVVEELGEKGIDFYFAGLTGPIRDVMARSELGRRLGPDRFHRNPHQAVAHILDRWDEKEGTERLDQYERSTELPEEEIDPTAESELT